MSEHDLDGAVTSCNAEGVRLQATGFSQKESEKEAARNKGEKEAGNIAHLGSGSGRSLWPEACGLSDCRRGTEFV